MNTLQKLIEAAQFKMTGGSEYLWSCFGSNARWLDLSVEKLKVECNIVFDCVTQEVYQAGLYFGDNAFRWNNPLYVAAYKQEAYKRDVDPRTAYDNTLFTDCDVFEDFISKVQECFTTGTCDTSVLLSIDFSPEVQELFEKLPEGTDLEQFITTALTEKIESFSQKNRENWDIVFSTLEQAGINVSIDVDTAPISEQNIQEIYNWVQSLNLTEVRLNYHDKETAQGIVCFITVKQENTPDLTFNYIYKKI